MYVMPVFMEECSTDIYLHGLILDCTHCVNWVSLIAGVGYRVEQWGGKWDGTMSVANSCN